MDTSFWISSLPNHPCQERDKAILYAVQNGLITYNWVPVTSYINNYTAIFQVCDDAVRVESDDGTRFRFPVSATLAQQCADLMDACFMTSKISDLSYQQAKFSVDAVTLPAGPDMININKSKQWNKLVESKRATRDGLFRDCGKAWILSNELTTSFSAINYGFYDKNAPYINPSGLKMWQTVGTKHNRNHTDYSQTLILMSKFCEINGQPKRVIDIMQDKILSPLLSYEGVLHFTRQPGT